MWWGVQRLDGAERRLVDYFDLVAGTSAGGLITAMITSPSTQDATRPLFTAKEVFNFYQKYANKIFPQTKYTRSLPLSLSYQPQESNPSIAIATSS
jgi:patatin-like phospholipase/acyl hydrolase